MMLYKHIFILISCCVIQGITSEIRCIPSENCVCTRLQAIQRSECPMNFPDITMEVSPARSVFIQCNKDISWDTSPLPFIEVGDSESVHLRTCQFPNTTFLSAMNKMGINNTKELKIDFTYFFENTLTADYFDSLGDLETLMLIGNSIEKIDENAFKLLNKLSTLTFRSNNIHILPNLFQNLSNLTMLEISTNDISYLPPTIFQNLTNLRFLSMWSNKLTALDKNLFRSLKNLQSVELLSNQLQDLPEDIFYGLSNLKNVSFAINKFRSLPENLFRENKALYFINFSKNRHLTTLPNNLFSNLTSLQHVYLNVCNLSRLPDNLFAGSLHIKRIFLQRNSLEQLSGEIFKDLRDIENLDLSYNKFANFPDAIFSSMDQLKSLNLRNNMLDNIGKELFSSLYNLEEINLENNRIRFIHHEAFQRMGELKTLILSHNRINFIDNYLDQSPFHSNRNLEKADLSYNDIASINEDWVSLKPFLKELDLSHNKIIYVEFGKLMTISRGLKMNLSHNQITTVDFELAELMASQQATLDAYSWNAANNVVSLNGNPMECNCYLYDFVRYLERAIDPNVSKLVTVVANDLTCASPENFVGFPVAKLKTNLLKCTLDQLHANATCPDKCECVVRLWNKALFVDCMNRNLTKIPEIILPKSNLIHQTIVYLQRNFIKEGPKVNMGYENVTQLYLSSNNINEILWLPPKIEVLDLSNNNITHINDDVISMLNTFTTLTNLSLGDNPWNCDCSAMSLTNFLISHITDKQIDIKSIKCKNYGMLLLHLNNTDVCPAYTGLMLVISIFIVLILLVIAISLAICYSNKKKIKVCLFGHYTFMVCHRRRNR